MNFDLPSEITDLVTRLDTFIEAEIVPLQAEDDNERFFDHRREYARTDFDNGGLPRPEWEALMAEAVRRADKAGLYRFSLPAEFGGQDGGNLAMAVVREHMAAKGLGLFNDLQSEHSVIGNFPVIVMLRDFGTAAQKQTFISGALSGDIRMAFGLTEEAHGSDATHMETRAVRETRDGKSGWRIDGEKCGPQGCTPRPIASPSRAPLARMARRMGSLLSWFLPRHRG